MHDDEDDFINWNDVRQRNRSWYDIAQVCLQGHVTNWATKDSPQLSKKHCQKCGSPTITNCPHCDAGIKGKYHSVGRITPANKPPPSYCENCGNPYPWTEASIKAAKELAEELDLNDDEKSVLKASIDDLIQDTPAAQVASVRFKKLVTKGGKAFAGAFRDILINIVSEAVKKKIWP